MRREGEKEREKGDQDRDKEVKYAVRLIIDLNGLISKTTDSPSGYKKGWYPPPKVYRYHTFLCGIKF